MKFLADENFPKPLITTIRKLGFSVKSIQQKQLQGSSDETVSSIAKKEKRVIITFDKDFLEEKTPADQIILFHFPKVPTAEIMEILSLSFKNMKISKFKVMKFSKAGFEKIN